MKESITHWKSKEDKNTYGRIINISSVHGVIGSINKSAYVAAKHGLIGLTKVVALENAESNITCNSICPGWVHTTLVQNQIELLSKEKGISEEEAKILLVSAKQPSKRFTTCEQIGEMVAFLCSNACSNLSGTEQIMVRMNQKEIFLI